MLRNLDIGTLRTLITVVDTAGVTKAANKLHLTQSTVSMQLKRLEETLGMPLVTRQGRSMCATEQGDQLLSYARKLVAMNDEAVDRLINSESGGELRFGVPYDIVEPHIPVILKKFVHGFPRVSVSLNADNTLPLIDEFSAGNLDIILTTELDTGVGGTVLLERDLVWTGAIGGRAWLQEPLPLAFTENCMFRKPAITALDKAGITWINSVGTGRNFDSGSIACAADLGVRADIKGFRAPGMEPIADATGRLPELPRYRVNMYVADGPNREMADVFSRLIRKAFSEQTDYIAGSDANENEDYLWQSRDKRNTATEHQN